MKPAKKCWKKTKEGAKIVGNSLSNGIKYVDNFVGIPEMKKRIR